ncbi:hypothetical protein LCGC14_1283770 [marine sediment metagenome]|uniref:Uncharacterized protein n=1 Tax=marine sediment metagenome TaxID=412755 RepID=A0A0F9NB23_9ZZZZ
MSDLKNALGTEIEFSTKKFTIAPLPIRKSREWREKFIAQLDTVLSIVDDVQGVSTIELTDGFSLDSLMPFIEKIKVFLLTSTDILLDLIYDFSPAIKKEKEWIEDHATDPEVFSVFLEVLKMAYPFGNILGNLRTLGQSPPVILTNSPEENGDSGQTN